jgi:hypothetical protein
MYKFTYKNEDYYFNPENPEPSMNLETGEMEYGDKLKNVLGMTNAEALQCHAEGLLNELRGERDLRLAKCDWAGSYDVSDSIKAVYAPYRQALRDITDTYTNLDDVVWPALEE